MYFTEGKQRAFGSGRLNCSCSRSRDLTAINPVVPEMMKIAALAVFTALGGSMSFAFSKSVPMEARKALVRQQKELSKAQARMTELDTLFRKLYEDNALGRLTDERFVFLTSGYEDEKKSLAAKIDELQQQIATVTERKRDISRFIQIVGKYSDIKELTYENVHEFIDRILIHELDRKTNTRKIEIHYSFVGQVDTEQEPTQVVNHDRRNMVDVKSIAI